MQRFCLILPWILAVGGIAGCPRSNHDAVTADPTSAPSTAPSSASSATSLVDAPLVDRLPEDEGAAVSIDARATDEIFQTIVLGVPGKDVFYFTSARGDFLVGYVHERPTCPAMIRLAGHVRVAKGVAGSKGEGFHSAQLDVDAWRCVDETKGAAATSATSKSKSGPACKTIADCWLDDDGNPIARPKAFAKKPLPKGDCGSHLLWLRNELGCEGGVCVATFVGDEC